MASISRVLGLSTSYESAETGLRHKLSWTPTTSDHRDSEFSASLNLDIVWLLTLKDLKCAPCVWWGGFGGGRGWRKGSRGIEGTMEWGWVLRWRKTANQGVRGDGGRIYRRGGTGSRFWKRVLSTRPHLWKNLVNTWCHPYHRLCDRFFRHWWISSGQVQKISCCRRYWYCAMVVVLFAKRLEHSMSCLLPSPLTFSVSLRTTMLFMVSLNLSHDLSTPALPPLIKDLLMSAHSSRRNKQPPSDPSTCRIADRSGPC